jgi:outer membrane protein OmpA-like peptidoglycan-associated protein
LTASTDLYAQWAPDIVPPVQVLDSTISFSSNGGAGSIAAETGTDGTSVTLPGGIGISYVGKTFASWNTAANGSGTSYNVDAPLKLSGSFTLYAQWDKLLVFKAPSILLGAVGTFSTSSPKLSSALKVQVKKLASLVKTGGYAVVTLYGYSSDSGTKAHKLSISRSRANSVAAYLRTQLNAMNVKGVTIDAAGEGSIKGKTSAVYRRVEVFVTA